MTFDQDRSPVRVGATPRGHGNLRTTIIGLLRCTGQTTSAGACRCDAVQPWQALALLTAVPRTTTCPWPLGRVCQPPRLQYIMSIPAAAGRVATRRGARRDRTD